MMAQETVAGAGGISSMLSQDRETHLEYGNAKVIHIRLFT